MHTPQGPVPGSFEEELLIDQLAQRDFSRARTYGVCVCVCVCMHMCMYVRVYIYFCMCVCMYIYIRS